MTYLLIALILTNAFWLTVVIVITRLAREQADHMAIFAQASDIACEVVDRVTGALTRQIHGDPAAIHGSLPPGADELPLLPPLDYTDPNDGLYREWKPAKMVEDDDFAFLHRED